MLPAAHRGKGMNICAPDVCLTPPVPPVPVPYVNVGIHARALNYSPNVFICCLNALHILSVIPMTSGDEPGIYGPGPMLVGQFQMGNPTIRINMIPAVNLTCPATGNAANAKGASLVPDLVNVLYTLAKTPTDHELSTADALSLRSALEDAPVPRGVMVDDGVAMIRIAVFTADVSTRIFNELIRLEAEGMREVIFDLRGCPGGDLTGALRLAEDFLPTGVVLAVTIDVDGDEVIHRSRRQNPYEWPLSLLVDHGTASAAELFAGCLQANGRATLMGETTYGKSTTQRVVHDLHNGFPIHATVGSWTLPNGDALDARGLEPDEPDQFDK